MNAKQALAGFAGDDRPAICPRVSIVAARPHVSSFLDECFEELGLATYRSGDVFGGIPGDRAPDLVAIDLSLADPQSESALDRLAERHYRGKVLILGPVDDPRVPAAREHGRRLGLAMLPALYTPCRCEDLSARVAAVMPLDPPPLPHFDVARALREGWVELWYQPKIDIRSLVLAGAEALARIRHPEWGIVPPACFLPQEGDPRLRALSDFVLARAAADWRLVAGRRSALNVAVNLPLSYLLRPTAIRSLRRHLAAQPEAAAPIVEINSSEIVHDPAAAAEVVERLRQERISVAADDVGAEWAELLGQTGLALAEIKVDRKFIDGVADNEEKKSMCRCVVAIAHARGVRTVAEGVETTEDLAMVRDIGFDMVQGFLFARPMHPHRFVRTFLRDCVVTQ